MNVQIMHMNESSLHKTSKVRRRRCNAKSSSYVHEKHKNIARYELRRVWKNCVHKEFNLIMSLSRETCWRALAWKLTWQRLIQSKLLLQPANFVFKIRSWMSQFRISAYTRQPREPHNPRRDIHESSSTHVIYGHKGSNCRTLHFITMETLLKLICHIVVIHPCRLWAFQICMLELHRNKTTTKRNSRNFAELIFKLSSQFFALAAFRVDLLFSLARFNFALVVIEPSSTHLLRTRLMTETNCYVMVKSFNVNCKLKFTAQSNNFDSPVEFDRIHFILYSAFQTSKLP